MKVNLVIFMFILTNLCSAFGQTKTCLLGPKGIKSGAHWISASIDPKSKIAYLHGWNQGGAIFSYLWNFSQQSLIKNYSMIEPATANVHWKTKQIAFSGGFLSSSINIGDFYQQFSYRIAPFQDLVYSPTFSSDGKTVAVLSSTYFNNPSSRDNPQSTLSLYDTKSGSLINAEAFAGSGRLVDVEPYFDNARNKFLIITARPGSADLSFIDKQISQVDPVSGQISSEVFNMWTPEPSGKLHAVMGKTFIFSSKMGSFTKYLMFYHLDDKTKKLELQFGGTFKNLIYLSHSNETVMAMLQAGANQNSKIKFISTVSNKVTQELEIKDKLIDGYFDDESVTYLNEQGHLCTVYR